MSQIPFRAFFRKLRWKSKPAYSCEAFPGGCLERIDVTKFGAVADSDTSPQAVARNDRALEAALAAAAKLTLGQRPALIYFPPGRGNNFYALSAFTLPQGNHIILCGVPGLLSSRIKLVSTLPTATGTSGIYFSGNHSWGGLKDITLIAGSRNSMTNLVEVDVAHNAMMFEGVYLNGSSICEHGLRVNHMSRFRINNFYSTGFREFNFYLAGVSSMSHIEVSSGNVDVGQKGFAYVAIGAAGPLGVVFSNVRMEGVADKKLVYFDVGVSGGNMRFYGCVATNGSPQALVYVFNSSGMANATAWVFADVTFQNSPKYWLEDQRGESNSIVFQGNFEAPKRLNIT